MRGLSPSQVEHDGRRRLVQTLLRTGPLTARGLATATGRSLSYVEHHLKVLAGTGIVEALHDRSGACNAQLAYAVGLGGQPEWVYEILFDGFCLRTCLLLMNQLDDAGSLGLTELARRTALSENEVAGYLWYLDALGLVEPANG